MDAFWALAVASSYTFEEGPKAGTTAEEQDAIYVRNVNEIEVKPKPKVYPNPPARFPMMAFSQIGISSFFVSTVSLPSREGQKHVNYCCEALAYFVVTN
ncbi:hypothetical protein JHK87_029144 [Glycine soja]|nr:hypothetical protein JHK87_029144 [Glycine soja]